MEEYQIHNRFAQEYLMEVLTDTPVVLIHGPRQCGKSTLARMVADNAGYAYITFDDFILRKAAKSDPIGFVSNLPEKVVLDEIQWVPELFATIKATVDAERIPGRFILTGSTNVLLLPKLADSLAGRMEILRLHPLAQAELAGEYPDFLTRLFQADFKTETSSQRLGKSMAEIVACGGFPAALARSGYRRLSAWYREFVETLIQRDVRDMSRIGSLDVLPRLMVMAAGQTACLFNVSELAAPFQLSRPTIREYLTLLERLFLVEELSPWYSNRLKRLVKTPKLHIGDTGLACTLLGLTPDTLWDNRSQFGRLLETFVYQEIRRLTSFRSESFAFYHFRNKDMVEVDIILESQGKLAGIEVKAASTVFSKDFNGLRKMQQAVQDKFAAGAVIYDGDSIVSFGPGLFAVPVSCLWRNKRKPDS